MALSATIFKTQLQIADMDRGYYAEHRLTLARHPSETDQRMMLRLIMFALFASETLRFTKGISTQDEPDIWEIDHANEIQRWIELGLPDSSRIKKAIGRANEVVVCAYGGRNVDPWWQRTKNELGEVKHLKVYEVSTDQYDGLADFVARTMNLQCTIQDGQIWLTNDRLSRSIDLQILYSRES